MLHAASTDVCGTVVIIFFPLSPYKLLKVTSPDMFLLVYLPRRHAARHSGKRGKTKKEWSETAWVNVATYVFFGAARKMSPWPLLLNNNIFFPTTLSGGDAKFAEMWIKSCATCHVLNKQTNKIFRSRPADLHHCSARPCCRKQLEKSQILAQHLAGFKSHGQFAAGDSGGQGFIGVIWAVEV